MEILLILIGFALGIVATSVYMLERLFVGELVTHDDEEDGTYLYARLTKDIPTVMKYKFVIMRISNSRKKPTL